jgi:hypothetical protein
MKKIYKKYRIGTKIEIADNGLIVEVENKGI